MFNSTQGSSKDAKQAVLDALLTARLRQAARPNNVLDEHACLIKKPKPR